MCTVPGAPDGVRESLLDPLRRRVDFADVFADDAVRASVVSLVDEIGRGRLDLRRLHELFADEAESLLAGVAALDRGSLLSAHRLMFVEEPAIARAMRVLLGEFGRPVDVVVADAVGEVIGAATRLERLGRAWVRFMHGNDCIG